MLRILIMCLLFIHSSSVRSQSFAINTDGSTADPSALLDVKSNTKGLLVPRMTKGQRNAIITPAAGLLTYVTGPDTTGLCYYNGSRWMWFEEKGLSWNITGNSGLNPSLHFIGTEEATDLRFRNNGGERMRLTTESEMGISDPDPKYTLDITTGFSAVTNCFNSPNGIRIKKAGMPAACNTGFVIGHGSDLSTPEHDNLFIWNYGQTGGTKNTLFGFGNGTGLGYEAVRITENREIGIDEPAPKYNLDIFTGGTTFIPCNNRLGLRINTPWTGGRGCDNGLFVGYNVEGSATSQKVSLWNFTANATTTGQYFRFGFGQDFSDTDPAFGEAVRILPPGQGMGIGTKTPLAQLHIANTTGNDVLPLGVMVTKPGLSGELRGFYTGLGAISGAINNDGMIWNFQLAPVLFGTNNLERMRIRDDGNISMQGYLGIGVNAPNAPLQFSNTVTNRKIVLYDFLNNDHQFYGLGISANTLRYQTPSLTDDHIFYSGVDNSSSRELVRIKGNGAVGIGISNPSFVLEINGRSRIHSGGTNGTSAGIWFNNNANTVSTGFVGMESDDAIGFYGTGTPNGWGVVMKIATGNVGIGTSSPSEKLQVMGNILATGTITPSDARYKNHIEPIADALTKLQQLNGVTYQMNTAAFPEWNFDNSLQYGLIAQEVETVFPEMVHTINADGYKGVDYVKLIPVLVESIKEQQQQIEALKKENREIKKRFLSKQ